jgi:hypothetical protein
VDEHCDDANNAKPVVAPAYTHERMRAAFESVARAAKSHGKAMGSAGRAPGFRVPELAVAARCALPDRRLRCRLHLSAGRADVKQLRELKL